VNQAPGREGRPSTFAEGAAELWEGGGLEAQNW
jgi:hypothetical protein